MNRIVSFIYSRYNQYRDKKNVKQIQLRLRLISGKHTTTGKQMKFLYSGYNQFNLNMWSDYLLTNSHEKNLEPIQFSAQSFKTLKLKYPECDFLLVEKTLLKREKFRFPHLYIPNLIQTWIDTSSPVKALCRPKKTGMNNARRIIRKYGLTCHQTNDKDDRKHFYEKMYVPYLRKNVSRYIRELPYNDIFKDSRPDQLYHIKMNNKLVAGAVATFFDGKAYFGFLGIIDGDMKYIKIGVTSAMYYFLAEDFHKRSFDKMYLGGSPPLLTHPLTRYKIRMSARHDSDHEYYDHEITTCFILNKAKAMDSLFHLMPFIFLKNGSAHGLFSLSKIDNGSNSEFDKLLKLPKRIGIENNIYLKASGNSLSTNWQKVLSDKTDAILSYNKFIKQQKVF